MQGMHQGWHKHDFIWACRMQAVFKGWSSFKENLGRRRSDFSARAESSDYSATDDELGVERSGGSTPASGEHTQQLCWLSKTGCSCSGVCFMHCSAEHGCMSWAAWYSADQVYQKS